MLSDRRNTKTARRFLDKALRVMRNWPPVSITTDKLGAYPKALRRLKRTGRAERHGPTPDVEVPQQQDRGRPWGAQTADPSHLGLPVDEDRLRHDQGLRDHAHDPPPSLHPDRTRGHRRSAIRQQTLRSRPLIRAAEGGRFYPTAVNATKPAICAPTTTTCWPIWPRSISTGSRSPIFGSHRNVSPSSTTMIMSSATRCGLLPT